MNLSDHLLNILKPFSKNIYYKKLLDRTNEGKLIKKENVESHFCVFFLPIHVPTKSIYLVHHKKANLWIPPGGHIEPNELPEQTVKREFYEELSFNLTNEEINLFDISVTNVSDSKTICKLHYDLWYVVYMKEKKDFIFSKKEFYNALWLSYQEALNKETRDINKKVIKPFISSLNNNS